MNWATRRIRQIAALLGDELVAEAVGQADDEFWRRYDPEIRRLFETDMPKFRTWQIASYRKMLAAGSEGQIH